MAGISGTLGHISKGSVGGGSEAAINCVRTWGVTWPAALKMGRCSASKGAQFVVPGIEDFSGQYTAYGAIPSVLPGDTFEFEGAASGSGASAKGAKGDCICDSVTINWDYEGGTPLNHSVSFSGNGPLTLGTVTCPADSDTPTPAPSTGLIVSLGKTAWGAALGSLATLEDVRTAALTLTRTNPSYASSSSAGVMKRVLGGFDATLSLSLYAPSSDVWASIISPNTAAEIRLYTDDTLYWLLKWMVIGELGGLDVDIEGGAIVGASLSGQFTGLWNVSGTSTEGSIALPGGSAVWPV